MTTDLGNLSAKSKSSAPRALYKQHLLLKYDLNHMYFNGTLSSPVTNTTHKVNYKPIVFLLYAQTSDRLDKTIHM